MAAHNLERSADEGGSYRDPIDEFHVDLGGRIGHLWVDTGTVGSRRSTWSSTG